VALGILPLQLKLEVIAALVKKELFIETFMDDNCR
jgi:hypothetical protein